MSSTTYSANLTPESWLRIIVLSIGRILFAVGTLLLLILDQHPLARGFACVAWLSFGRFRLLQLCSGFDACIAVRVFPEGTASVLTSDAEWVSARMLPGSLILRKLAWLRLRTDNGQVHQELLRGDARKDLEWRRLQVIWRHFGAVR